MKKLNVFLLALLFLSVSAFKITNRLPEKESNVQDVNFSGFKFSLNAKDNIFNNCMTDNYLCSRTHATVKSDNSLLQFTGGGHVIGFEDSGVYFASRDHMLKVNFIGSKKIKPNAENGNNNDSESGIAQPLEKVKYSEVWDGVTVVYEKSRGAIAKSTYFVDAGKEVEQIRLRYNSELSIDKSGNLEIMYETGKMVEQAPVAWQEVNGKRQYIPVKYKLQGNNEIGFETGNYDKSKPLVIDPSLTWNTFLGGSGNDNGNGIAIDGSGNVYVGGYSSATWGSPVRAYTSGNDAFAAKLNSSGELIWNTFLGDSGNDQGNRIAVDGSGNVYVTGQSSSTWGSPVRAYTFSNDAFAAKLNSSGELIWNTFLGGGGNDNGSAIAVDGSNNVYVGGYSSTTWGSPVRAYTYDYDAFAAKLNSSGELTWNSFLGGNGSDQGPAIAVDGSGNVYVGGFSSATYGVRR